MEQEPKPGTQEFEVLQLLRKKKGRWVTPLDAINLIDPPVCCLAERVRELRRKGWDIENVKQAKRGGTCGRYVLTSFLGGGR